MEERKKESVVDPDVIAEALGGIVVPGCYRNEPLEIIFPQSKEKDEKPDEQDKD